MIPGKVVVCGSDGHWVWYEEGQDEHNWISVLELLSIGLATMNSLNIFGGLSPLMFLMKFDIKRQLIDFENKFEAICVN